MAPVRRHLVLSAPRPISPRVSGLKTNPARREDKEKGLTPLETACDGEGCVPPTAAIGALENYLGLETVDQVVYPPLTLVMGVGDVPLELQVVLVEIIGDGPRGVAYLII